MDYSRYVRYKCHNKMIAQVGDPLAIRFEILDTDTPYDMFVRELVATDGAESAEVLLVDTLGCPTDTTIVQSLAEVRPAPAKILQARAADDQSAKLYNHGEGPY